LLLFIPSATSEEEYTRFREATAEAFAKRGAALPEALPDPVRPSSEPPVRGAIHFADDWTPTVVSLAPPSVEVSREIQLLNIQAKLRPILASLPAEAPFNPPEPHGPADDRQAGADQQTPGPHGR